MSPTEYWDLNVFAAGAEDWRNHPTVARTVSLLAGIITFFAAYVFVSEPGARFWSRVLTGVIALGVSTTVLGVLFVLWVWLVVPFRQRGEASRRVVALAAHIAERDKIEFMLTASYGEGGAKGYVNPTDNRTFHPVATLWVEVANEGRVAEFSARIPHTPAPVARLEDGLRPKSIGAYDVAWEQTLSWRRDLGVGRLKIANVAVGDAEPIFWFWTAENATWNRDEFGRGWRLVPLADVIEFPLIVTNITDRKSATRTCRITFSAGAFASFGFVEAPPEKDSDPQEQES